MGRVGVDRRHDALLARELYRAFVIRGFKPAEAGNLVAIIFGLRVHRTPWTWRQVATLLALRAESERRPLKVR